METFLKKFMLLSHQRKLAKKTTDSARQENVSLHPEVGKLHFMFTQPPAVQTHQTVHKVIKKSDHLILALTSNLVQESRDHHYSV